MQAAVLDVKYHVTVLQINSNGIVIKFKKHLICLKCQSKLLVIEYLLYNYYNYCLKSICQYSPD